MDKLPVNGDELVSLRGGPFDNLALWFMSDNLPAEIVLDGHVYRGKMQFFPIWLEEEEYLRPLQDYCEVWIDDLRKDPQCVHFKEPDNIQWDTEYVYQTTRRT